MTQQEIEDFIRTSSSKHNETKSTENNETHSDENSTRHQTEQETPSTETIQDIDATLPELDIPWRRELTEYKGATVATLKPEDGVIKRPGGATILPSRVAYVADGFNKYLSNTNATRIEPPESYSTLQKQFPALRTARTAVSSSGFYGITPDDLETGIKIAAGGGRFSTDNLAIFTGDPEGIAIKYNDTTIVIHSKEANPALHDHDTKEVHPDRDYHIEGYSVVEDLPHIRDRLQSFIQIHREYSDTPLPDNHELVGGSHIFTGDNGAIKISDAQLRTLPPTLKDETEITGTTTIKPDIGDPADIVVPEVPYKLGETNKFDNIVIGYETTYGKGTTGIYESNNTPQHTRIPVSAVSYLAIYTVSYRTIENSNTPSPTYRARINRETVEIGEYEMTEGRFLVKSQYRSFLDRVK